jgi:hypothetical protein
MHATWKATFAAAVTVGVLSTFGALSLVAQAPAKRSVDVTVTDPYGRTVAGLNKDYFAVSENGAQRTITAFSELRDETPRTVVHYRLEFESPAGGTPVEVVFHQPPELPHLTITWK